MEMKKIICPKCGGTVALSNDCAGGCCSGCGANYQVGGDAPLRQAEPAPALAQDPGNADISRPAVRGQLGVAARAREEENQRRASAARESARVASAPASAPSAPAPVRGRVARKSPASRPFSGNPFRDPRGVDGVLSAGRDGALRLPEARGLIKKKKWARANELLDDILMRSPTLAEAHVLKVMAANRKKKEAGLAEVGSSLAQNRNFELAMRYADPALRARLESYLEEKTPDEESNGEVGGAVIAAAAVIGTSADETANETRDAEEKPAETAPSDERKKEKKEKQEKQEKQEKHAAPAEDAADAEGEESAPQVAAIAMTPAAAELAIADTDRRLVEDRQRRIDRTELSRKLARADRARKRKKWGKADRLYDEVLLSEPECAEAYLGKLLVAQHMANEKELARAKDLAGEQYFALAMFYSAGNLRKRLNGYVNSSNANRIAAERRDVLESARRDRALSAIADERLAEVKAQMSAQESEDREAGLSPEEADARRSKRLSAVLDRADKALSRKRWKRASALYRDALEIDGTSSEAYIGLLLVDLRLNEERKLAHYDRDFEMNENFLLALHFGSRATRQRLEYYLHGAQKRGGLAPVSVKGKDKKEKDRKEKEGGDTAVLPLALAAGAAGAEVAALREEMLARFDSLAASSAEANGANAAARAEDAAEVARIRSDLSDKLDNISSSASDAQSAELAAHAATLSAVNEMQKVLSMHLDTSRSEVSGLREEMNARFDSLTAAVASNRDEQLIYSAREAQVHEAERAALLARVHAAEAAADDARVLAHERAELDARMTAAESELARLRGDPATLPSEAEIDKLLARADAKRAKGRFAPAVTIYSQVLKMNPTRAEGYLGLLLCELKLRKEKKLEDCPVSFSDRENYALAVRFAEPGLRKRLVKYAEQVDKRVGRRRIDLERVRGENEAKRIENAAATAQAIVVAEGKRAVEIARASTFGLSAQQIDSKLARARRQVRRGSFDRARETLAEITRLAPDTADAYILLLMCDFTCRRESKLGSLQIDIRTNRNYILACHFGKRATCRRLAKYAESSAARAARASKQSRGEYQRMLAVEEAGIRSERDAVHRALGDRYDADRAAVEMAAARAAVRSKNHEKNKRLCEKGMDALARKKWERAGKYFSRVLEDDPASADAHIGKLLLSLSCRDLSDLAAQKTSFRTNHHYTLALSCADLTTKQRLIAICERVDARARSAAPGSSQVLSTHVELGERRRENLERELRQANVRNRELENEVAQLRAGKHGEGRDGDYRLHGECSIEEPISRSPLSSLGVALFLLGGLVLTVLAVGIGILFAKYGGSVTDMLAAFRK